MPSAWATGTATTGTARAPRAGDPRPCTLRRRPRGDDGQILVLALAYALLAIVLVTVVVSATAVHLERKRLLALADLAALAAADAMAVDAYYAGTTADATVVLTPDGVRDAVVEYLRDAPAAQAFASLDVDEATTDDGRTARVTLRAVADVPLVTLVTAAWSDGVELVVTSRARAG